ncbi:hypothetical protein DL96DRAFT_72503 [Flagelloscypha sp. PMI_526]|nr:hypothetical protein DL96DRAFT_72503 [Flagelloscypha sp. PMI_526]
MSFARINPSNLATPPLPSVSPVKYRSTLHPLDAPHPKVHLRAVSASNITAGSTSHPISSPSHPRHHSSSSASSILAMFSPQDDVVKSKKLPHSANSFAARLKRSTRQLKQLFIDPALQELPVTTRSPSPIESDEDYGNPLSVVSPQPEHHDPRPLIARSRSSVHPYGSDAPYVQSYDHLESELYNHILLRRINPVNGPTFHEYTVPPKQILDLGCGVGHWAAFAANYWMDSTVTAFDMVDVRASSMPMPSNCKFVMGNYVKYTLPFENDTFDFIRMADLTLTVPLNRWNHLLGECNRVLTVGGRLEIIQDLPLWAYAAAASASSPAPSSASSSDDLSKRSSGTSVSSVFDTEHSRDSIDTLLTEDELLENVEGEKPLSRRPSTRSSSYLRDLPAPTPPPSRALPDLPSESSQISVDEAPVVEENHEGTLLMATDNAPAPLPDLWLPTYEDRCESSARLERVYQFMLEDSHGIYAGCNEFLARYIESNFDCSLQSNDTYTIQLAQTEALNHKGNLTLATSWALANRMGQDELQLSADKLGVKIEDVPASSSLPSCPGLLVTPSSSNREVFLPMSAQELEYHACHHVHKLLSSKHAIYNHMYDDPSTASPKVFDQKIFDYECFRRERFGWKAALPELSWEDFEDEDEPLVASPRSSQDSPQRASIMKSLPPLPPVAVDLDEDDQETLVVRSFRVYSICKIAA